MAKGQNFRAMRHHNFRVLYPASVLSNIGTWAQRIAQDWLVLELTHSSTALGIVTALQFAPTLVFSAFGGLLADRFDKRKLLFITNAGSGIVALVLGLLVISGAANIWHVYFLAFVLGTFSAIDAPIRQTFTGELVDQTDVANAISLNSVNFNIGRLVGPGVSGLLIAAFGTGPSFLLNAATYVAVIFSLGFIRKNELNRQPRSDSRVKMKTAFKYFTERRDLQIVLAVAFMGSTFGMNYQIYNALMATQEFHKGPAEFGGLGTFLAIGSLTGALFTQRFERFRNPKGITISMMTFGLFIALLSLSTSYEMYSLILPFGGMAGIVALVSANTYVQTTTEPHLRGRIMGIYMTVLMGGTPMVSPILGWLADTVGIRLSIVTFGLLTAGLSVCAYLFINRTKNVSL